MKKIINNLKIYAQLLILLMMILCNYWLILFVDQPIPEEIIYHFRYPQFPLINFICIASLLLVPIFIFPQFIKGYFLILFPCILLTCLSIGYFFFQGVPFNKNTLAILTESNFDESYELLINNIEILLTCICFFTIYLLIIKTLPKKLNIKNRFVYAFILFIISVISLSYSAPNENYIFHLRNHYYPFSVVEDTRELISYYQSLKSYKERIRNFQFNAKNKSTNQKRIVTILVIGETSRYDHWQINGYERETSPLLMKLENLISFSNVSSSANLTYLSVPMMITRASPSNYSIRLKEKSVVAAFNEANFETIWISSHSKHFFNNSPISIYANQANKTIFLRNTSVDGIPNDEELLKPLKNEIESTNKNTFIVLHTWGSHFDYRNRYPKRFNKFNSHIESDLLNDKKELINSYDNSILYTDNILNEIAKLIKDSTFAGSFIYMPDHGENLLDNNELVLHGRQFPTYYETHIPLFIYLNKEYKRNFPEVEKGLIFNKEKKISHENLFHSLLNLSFISYPEEDLTKSFTNKSFIDSKQQVLISDSVFTYFDSLKLN